LKSPVFRQRNTERARELRRTASPMERTLWAHLSAGKVAGHRFTRQYQIGPYFADFLCRAKKLVIEIDGPSHDAQQESDAARSVFLEKQGYRTLRFTNEEVMTNIEGVVTAIGLALDHMPSPNPSRRREGNK
jgi:very-short-patch-repair endonuclease